MEIHKTMKGLHIRSLKEKQFEGLFEVLRISKRMKESSPTGKLNRTQKVKLTRMLSNYDPN